MSDGFSKWVNRLALGTVQFGLDYGISNNDGKVSLGEAESVLAKSATAGIHLLDTARAYGNSETVIGKTMGQNRSKFSLVSKLAPGCLPEQVVESVQDSLNELAVEKLYGYLAHSFSDFKDARLRDALYHARDRGLVGKVGCSLYFPQEMEWILENGIQIDLVQLPFNVFDQRFRALFPLMRETGVEIHARSAFLQGLFFLSRETLRERFPSAVEPHARFLRICEKNDLAICSALLNFSLAEQALDKVLIGVTNSTELDHNLTSFKDFERCRRLHADFAELAMLDEKVILPFNWS